MSLTNTLTTYSSEEIQSFMVHNLADLLGKTSQEIDVDEHLENYGLDSAQAMVIISKLEELEL